MDMFAGMGDVSAETPVPVVPGPIAPPAPPPSRSGALALDLDVVAFFAVPAAIGAGIGRMVGSKRYLRNAAIGAAVPVGLVASYLALVAITGKT